MSVVGSVCIQYCKLENTLEQVLTFSLDRAGSTMGSADEFKRMIDFVSQHKIVPIIDTVIDGLDNANKGFVSRERGVQ